MNKQNQNDQNKDWSKQQKGSNEGMSGSSKQDQSSNKAWDKDANKQSGNQGQGNQGQQPNKGAQEPVEERSTKASGERQQDKKPGENRDPEINMPSNEPEKTEKKIPNYE